MSPEAQRHFERLVEGPQSMPIMAMRDSWYQELREDGLIDTGQEMAAVAANFPDGPALVVPNTGVNPLRVWVRLSAKGQQYLKELQQ